MKTAASNGPFRFGRAAICAAVAAGALVSSFGCGANGRLFGRKEPKPPQTVKDFLALERPK